jgi:hypothetical protein
MNLKKLLINTIMIGALAITPLTFYSCSNDDNDDNNISKPNIEKGKAKATITGDSNDEIVADGNISVINDDGNTIILWSDKENNDFRMGFNEIGKTGTYDADIQSRIGFVELFYKGETWQSQNGKIGITTNNENRIAGTINDVELKRKDQRQGSLTVNGEFNALKNGGSGNDENVFILTGAASDTVDFSQSTLANPEQPVQHKQIGLGGQQEGTATIQIVPADAPAGELNVVMQDNVGSNDTPDNYTSMTLNYNGNAWMATGSGKVNLNTNDSASVEGELNDVVLSPQGSDDEVTVNGTFAASN